MPLHDWTDSPGWEGLHHFWMTEIARSLRAVLPPGYRAVIGASPLVALGVSPVKPDVGVAGPPAPPASAASHPFPEPDAEVAVADLDEDLSVTVERDGRVVAAVELVSPRNKDRPAARNQYAGRYLNYLRGGVHLLIVDVHGRPAGFSFPQRIAATLGADLPAPAAPSAVAYRVGPPAAAGGRLLAVGSPLPDMPLPLEPDLHVAVPLDPTYSRAAADCYLE